MGQAEPFLKRCWRLVAQLSWLHTASWLAEGLWCGRASSHLLASPPYTQAIPALQRFLSQDFPLGAVVLNEGCPGRFPGTQGRGSLLEEVNLWLQQTSPDHLSGLPTKASELGSRGHQQRSPAVFQLCWEISFPNIHGK